MQPRYSHSIAAGIAASRHGKKRAAVHRRPAFRSIGYFVSWMRLISAAYFAPYLSRTGCVAL